MARLVCKFGGTSVADAAQVRRVEAILALDPRRRVVVVSAPGKRHATDRKITDLLFTCHQLAQADLDYAQPLGLIADRFTQLAAELHTPGAADQPLADLRAGLAAGQSADWVASRGEHISARVIAAAFGATFVETAAHLGIDEAGLPTPDSYPRLAAALDGDGLFIVPGYYGHGPDGAVKVFSRGGSDITGAAVARAVGAAVYENWTDVSGFMMADPRIVPEARPIGEITYRELRELAYMGASVLHDESVFPVRQVDIPIHIKNTNAPQDPGTRIVAERDFGDRAVVGIAGRRDFTVLHIAKDLMNKELGFGRRVLAILERHGINFEHMPSGIDSMSVVMAEEDAAGKLDAVLDEVRRTLQPDNVWVAHDLALVTTVGEGMAFRVGIAARCFSALAAAGVNVRMITQGVAEVNIVVGVARDDFETAVRALYQAFVAQQL
jgi:aspartate kinase